MRRSDPLSKMFVSHRRRPKPQCPGFQPIAVITPPFPHWLERVRARGRGAINRNTPQTYDPEGESLRDSILLRPLATFRGCLYWAYAAHGSDPRDLIVVPPFVLIGLAQLVPSRAGEWIWYVALAALISLMVAGLRTSRWSDTIQVIVGILYMCAAISMLPLLALITACTTADCL